MMLDKSMSRLTISALLLAMLVPLVPAASADDADCYLTQPYNVKKLVELVTCTITQDGACSATGLTCVSAGASAYIGFCVNPVDNSVYDCWGATASATGTSLVGLVSTYLTANANGVPLADWCFDALGSCTASAGAYEYPGAIVVVSGEGTAQGVDAVTVLIDAKAP